MSNNKKVKHWGFYLANIPFWDNGSINFKYKTRPVLIYNFSGDDVIVLPVTSNEDDSGKAIKNNEPWKVKVKLEKHSLIKVNNPITLNKSALFKYFGLQANNKARRQVRHAWATWTTLKEIKR